MSTIERVEAIPVSYPEPNDFDAIRHLCLVRVTDSDGRVGWGEAVTMWPEASLATKALVDGMSDLLVGRDALDLDEVVGALHDRVWWYGYGGGIASFAIAALDIALWDLKGRILGRGVLELLGGLVHARLPAVASCHASLADIDALVDEAVGWLETGVHGVKVGFGKRGHANLGFDHDRDVEYVRRMRAGLGPAALLMVDCGWSVRWDVTTAIRRVQAFEEHGLHWIEEPLGAWDPAGYAELKAATSTLIAYGEREWSVDGYERLLAAGTVDVVGIDPGRAEGITGYRAIAALVADAGHQTNAHAWSSAIVTAASLALSFASPASRLIEVKPLRNPMQHELVARPIEHASGWFTPPRGPGLGIEVIDEVVDFYRAERSEARAGR
jgi:L-alanine-DL-glutamate epimerase-like enolase superfamily enzyme